MRDVTGTPQPKATCAIQGSAQTRCSLRARAITTQVNVDARHAVPHLVSADRGHEHTLEAAPVTRQLMVYAVA